MRRWFVVFLALVATVFLALAVLPWWFGPILHRAGQRFGVNFASYQRLGYARFRLNEVTFEQPDVRVRVATLEVDTPVRWLFRHWRHSSSEMIIGAWRVDAIEVPRPEAPVGRPHGAAATQQSIGRIARALGQWVPRAELGPGIVTWPGDQITLGAASLRPLHLEARPVLYQKIAANADFDFSLDGKITTTLRDTGGLGWSGHATWKDQDMAGEVLLWQQKADLTARWVENGWKVESGKVTAENWNIPAEKIGLGATFTVLNATAVIDWLDGRFSARVEARAAPPPKGLAPPLVASLHATGDARSVRVEDFAIHVPGVEVQLTAPWEINARASARSMPSQLRYSLDLAQQKFFPAVGKVVGTATLTPQGNDWPVIDATFAAADLKMNSFALARASGAAHLHWPALRVDDIDLEFNEGGKLAAEASWDFAAHALSGAKIGGVVRPSLLAPWLPAGVTFESINLAATAAGTWPALRHTGNIVVSKAALPPVAPLHVALSWEGVGREIKIPSLTLVAGSSEIAAVAIVSGENIRIEKLDLTNAHRDKLSLEAPVMVRWAGPFSVTALTLRNEATAIRCDYRAGATGTLNFSLDNFSPDWIQEFYAGLGDNWRARHFELEAKWNRGPWDFRTAGNGEISLAQQRAATLELAARGEHGAVVVEKLHVSEGEIAIMDITGKLPLAVQSSAGPKVLFRPNDPLEFHVRTSENPEFWERVKVLTGVELESPQLTADVSGTWREPSGTVQMKAGKISLERLHLGFAVPRITALEASLRATRHELAVENFAARIEDQAIRLSGELPLREDQWNEFRQEPWKFFQGSGHLHVQIPDADVAPIARYLPGTLAPSGKIHLDAELKPGGTATGTFQVAGVVARSFGPFGVLQDIQADVRFEGKDARVIGASARAGGQEMRITGDVGLPFGAPLHLNLAFDGHDIPIVRETGLLVRADVALRLSTNARRVSEISGDIYLRDSMFLSDVRAFLPSGGGGPSRRPPYFAVESPLLSNWRLAVNVRGDHFLRLRSTVFVGVASARFYLDGTLGQPHATGEVAVDSGDILLPFATFAVQQGSIRLTDADPFNLALAITGTSRRYGYDLRMDVDGTVAKPRVVFSSSPPLEARQVLLMVTAGEVPNDAISYGTTQRVARLGTYLGQSLLTSFGGDSGKADRLSISTGERVSLQGRETYDIEYKLNNRYTLVGEYDEFDDYNVGVKYRLGKIPTPKAPKLATPTPAEKDDASAPAP